MDQINVFRIDRSESPLTPEIAQWMSVLARAAANAGDREATKNETPDYQIVVYPDPGTMFEIIDGIEPKVPTLGFAPGDGGTTQLHGFGIPRPFGIAVRTAVTREGTDPERFAFALARFRRQLPVKRSAVEQREHARASAALLSALDLVPSTAPYVPLADVLRRFMTQTPPAELVNSPDLGTSVTLGTLLTIAWVQQVTGQVYASIEGQAYPNPVDALSESLTNGIDALNAKGMDFEQIAKLRQSLEEARLEAKNRELDEMRSRFDRVLQDAEQKSSELEGTVVHARESAGIVAGASLAEHFEKLADSELGNAAWWNGATLLGLLALLVAAGYFALFGPDNNVETVVRKAAVGVTAFVLIAFLARQGTHHRQNGTWAKHMSVQLKSVRAYTDELEPEQRRELLLDFGRTVFAGAPRLGRAASHDAPGVDEAATILEKSASVLKAAADVTKSGTK